MDATITLRESEFKINLKPGSLPVFCVEPDNDVRLPGLILIHEIFGVNDHIKDVARRFAHHGIRVYAPDLFVRSEFWPAKAEDRNNLEVMREAWASIPDSQLMADLDALFTHMYSKVNINGKIGSIGYCMGGAIALLLGCHEPKLAFVVDYYGRIRYGSTSKTKPKDPVDYLVPLKAPVLALFAGNDELIPTEHIEYLEKRMQELEKTYQLKVYENASHAFFNDQRPNYNREASEDAWQLTLAFIKKNTKEERSGPL